MWRRRIRKPCCLKQKSHRILLLTNYEAMLQRKINGVLWMWFECTKICMYILRPISRNENKCTWMMKILLKNYEERRRAPRSLKIIRNKSFILFQLDYEKTKDWRLNKWWEIHKCTQKYRGDVTGPYKIEE